VPQTRDVDILRDVARRYRDLAAQPVMDERRDLWRRHNSLERTRPLVLVMWSGLAWRREAPDEFRPRSTDEFCRAWEAHLLRLMFHDCIGDDWIIEPWVTIGAATITPPEGPYGVPYRHTPSTEEGGAWLFDPPIKELDDVKKLVRPRHEIDEAKTAESVGRLQDAVGDIIEVNLDRSPYYRHWHGDISYDLIQLRGIEQVMWDMVDNREWLHRLITFMRDGILEAQTKAEENGDWRLASHQNQAMAYAKELRDPCANSAAVKRKDLWYFIAAQEMAQVSPAMHEEFIYSYQRSIGEHFGLVAYGCCEDLTRKIDMLRALPNLRRIGVTPVADVAKCAEQIRDDYVFSWRPNPAEMICCGYDPDHVRKVIRDGMEASKGCHVDITLKDVETFMGRPYDLHDWVKVVREVTDEYV